MNHNLIHIWIISIFIALFFQLGTFTSASIQIGKVHRVIDGDTIIVTLNGAKEKVRLIGVDTPETVDPRRPVQYFGKEASAFTKKHIEGQTVRLDIPGQDRDRYNRILAYVYRASDDFFINYELIKQGYGFAYTKYPFKYMKEFRKAERRARENGLGLWARAISARTKPENAGQVTKRGPPGDLKVFITNYGKKYHRSTCKYLKRSRIEISLEEAKRKGFTPCKKCKPLK